MTLRDCFLVSSAAAARLPHGGGGEGYRSGDLIFLFQIGAISFGVEIRVAGGQIEVVGCIF